MNLLEDIKIYLKIYGERNTGTNYLERIVAQNFFVQVLRGDGGVLFRVSDRLTRQMELGTRRAIRQDFHDLEARRIRESDFGWKHGAPTLDTIACSLHGRHTLFLLVTKHPYFWIRSLWRRPYDFRSHDEPISAFMRAPWPLNRSDNLEGTTAPSPLAMLRRKLDGYLALLATGHDVVHVRYEDLLVDFEGQMARFACRLVPRQPAQDGFRNIARDVKQISDETTDAYRKKYDLTQARKALDPEDREFVLREVGEETFAAFGYAP